MEGGYEKSMGQKRTNAQEAFSPEQLEGLGRMENAARDILEETRVALRKEKDDKRKNYLNSKIYYLERSGLVQIGPIVSGTTDTIHTTHPERSWLRRNLLRQDQVYRSYHDSTGEKYEHHVTTVPIKSERTGPMPVGQQAEEDAIREIEKRAKTTFEAVLE